MFKNYLKIALRNLLKHKAYSFINVAGLGIGLTCCLLILLFVRDEYSFDGFHTRADRIYRLVNSQMVGSDASKVESSLPGPTAEAMIAEYPQVTDAAKLYKWFERKLLRHGEHKFYVENFIYTNAAFFSVFDFQILEGDPVGAFSEPQMIVVTESMSHKFFGQGDPIGRILVDEDETQFKVVAVAKDPPQNSHIQFDILVSWPSAQNIGWLNSWRATSAKTYVLLTHGSDAAALEQKFPQFLQKYLPNKAGRDSFSLQPLRDVHFRSTHITSDFNWQKGNMAYVYGLSAIAVFVLLIACFNFMNFATAHSAKRAKEIGLRKVIGAERRRLIVQFLGEAILTALLALAVAVTLVELLMPHFERLIGRTLETSLFSEPITGVGIFALTLLVGLFAGSYPALFLSALRPINVLRGSFKSGSKGILARKLFVFLQFALTVTLLIATGVVHQQLQYVANKDLGFRKEQVVIARMATGELREKFEPFKNDLLASPSVLGVSASNYIMGEGLTSFSIYPDGFSEDESWIVSAYVVDEDFVPTLGIEMKAGRNFSSDFASDPNGALVVNEALAKTLSWDDPIGKKIGFNLDRYTERTIVGVTKDFHFKSLHEEIEPMMLLMYPNWLSYNISMRISGDDLAGTLTFLKERWSHYFPNHPFQYAFLDQEFNRLYQRDQKIGEIVSCFAFWAIFVASLGLFGLASFATQQRTKEVGIRKVLGASVSVIILLLSREFARPVVLANVIAWPAAHYVMSKWLSNFAYRTSLSWDVFILAGGLALTIALLTVCSQAMKAALANPAKSLRYE